MTTKQPRRTHEGIRQALVSYHHLRNGGHLAPPEDSLGTQRVPQTAASFENSSDLRCDAEIALRKCSSVSFQDAMVTFEYLSSGGGYRARKIVGKRWGMHGSMIHAISVRTLDRMVEYLTGKRPAETGR